MAKLKVQREIRELKSFQLVEIDELLFPGEECKAREREE